MNMNWFNTSLSCCNKVVQFKILRIIRSITFSCWCNVNDVVITGEKCYFSKVSYISDSLFTEGNHWQLKSTAKANYLIVIFPFSPLQTN